MEQTDSFFRTQISVIMFKGAHQGYLNAVHNPKTYFPQIHSNIILSSMRSVSQMVSSLQFLLLKCIYISHNPDACCMLCPSPHPSFGDPNILSSSLCNSFHYRIASCLLRPNIFNLCSSRPIFTPIQNER